MQILPDRLAMARYGLTIRDVMDVVEVGLGGLNVSTTIEGRARYPIQLRLERERTGGHGKNRRHPHYHQGRKQRAIGAGGQSGTGFRDRARSPVKTDCCESSCKRMCSIAIWEALSHEVRQRIEKEVCVAPGVTLKWSGQYEHQINAQRTLMLHCPGGFADYLHVADRWCSIRLRRRPM